ncbi:hypothetical protein HPG69_013975 [Diceros bicornis minor]|uniref:Uncharacterized protein n=1 Tax=Diceros bicornis minor TaxID=77932 RepID=A0A7J7EN43_DICBM|nr:hypothetical protein HPG69_013975 [Diceros bicornis minor]
MRRNGEKHRNAQRRQENQKDSERGKYREQNTRRWRKLETQTRASIEWIGYGIKREIKCLGLIKPMNEKLLLLKNMKGNLELEQSLSTGRLAFRDVAIEFSREEVSWEPLISLSEFQIPVLERVIEAVWIQKGKAS